MADQEQPRPPVPVGEISVARLASVVFSVIALLLAFVAVVVSTGDGGSEKVTQGGAVGDGGDVPEVATPAGAAIDFNATPSDGWAPYEPALAPAPGGTEHTLTLEATETVMEVAPGFTQEMWTFDDTVPGPILRGKVGDVFTITLVNKGKLGHSIDFHASKVAWNDEMRTIAPGESLTYQFEAKHSGIFMYHCGTPPTLHHIGNGMYGALIVDPPDLPAVDGEFLFVQSELYTGPVGQPGDVSTRRASTPSSPTSSPTSVGAPSGCSRPVRSQQAERRSDVRATDGHQPVASGVAWEPAMRPRRPPPARGAARRPQPPRG